MTLEQLAQTYNFHDCDVFTPFEVEQNSVTVVFDLAKHLQYEDFQTKQSHFVQNKGYSLLVTVRFNNCTNLTAKEWIMVVAKNKMATQKQYQKDIPVEQLDWNLDFVSLCIENSKKIWFVFENAKGNDGFDLSFDCDTVEILEEKFVDADALNATWDEFEKRLPTK